MEHLDGRSAAYVSECSTCCQNRQQRRPIHSASVFGALSAVSRCALQRRTGLTLLLLLNLVTSCMANPDAKRLYDDLMSNYNRLIRPVSNHTEQITVKLGVRLSQLVELVRTLDIQIIALILHALSAPY